MRTRSRLPLFFALALAATAPAQEDRSLSATVLVRCGPGDVVLNADLVEAIVQDPAVEAAVRKAAGAGLTRFRGIGVSLPAAHLAGTYQVEFTIDLQGTGEWTRETKDQIVDVVDKQLEKRLSALLYEGPMRLLAERRAELADRHAKLLGEHAALRARAERGDAEAETVHKLGETLEQQFVAARLELATEQRANEYLEKLRAEHGDRRDSLRRDREHIDAQHEQLQAELAVLNQRIMIYPANGTNQQQAELAALRDQLAALQAKLQEQTRSQHRVTAALADVEDVLSRTLEQLPASTLVMQRARARLDSLEAERKTLEARAAQCAAQRAEAAQFAAQAEQLQIDVTVCRTLLTEVQGKLGRLEPVRCELLRQN
jgi:hypothetical protein